MPNVFGIADDILIIGYEDNSTKHDRPLCRILQIWRKDNVKQRQMPFQMHECPFLWEIISKCGMKPDPHKFHVLTEMHPLKLKKGLQSFLGIMNYLSKYSLAISDICEHLWWLTSVKSDWMWSRMYQIFYERTKALVKKDACMKFHDEKNPLLILDKMTWPWSWTCIDKEEHKMSNKWGTRQHNPLTNITCQQKPIQCKNPV